MTIRGAKSIAEFKQMQQAKIERWIDRHFLPEASITWKMHGANAIELTDKNSDTLIVSLDEID